MKPTRVRPALLLVVAGGLAPVALEAQPAHGWLDARGAWGGWHDDRAVQEPRSERAARRTEDRGTAGVSYGATAAPARSGADATTADDGRIEGFMGLRWHADSTDIVAELGEPLAVSKRKSGFTVFSYTPMFLQRDGFLNLWIDPELGLLRASYEAVTTRCTEYMRSIVEELRRRHPRVPSRTRGNVELERLDKSLCSAVLDDGANLTMVWTDRQGNRLQVGAGPEDPALRMVGTTDEFGKRYRRSP